MLSTYICFYVEHPYSSTTKHDVIEYSLPGTLIGCPYAIFTNEIPSMKSNFIIYVAYVASSRNHNNSLIV